MNHVIQSNSDDKLYIVDDVQITTVDSQEYTIEFSGTYNECLDWCNKKL